MKGEKISELAAEFILKQSMEELRKLTLAKIAKSLGVSRGYLSRRFKKDQGIMFSKFLLREKLYRAFFILTKVREKPVDELAMDLGFLKVAVFDREFEEFFGIGPGKFRDLKKKPFMTQFEKKDSE